MNWLIIFNIFIQLNCVVLVTAGVTSQLNTSSFGTCTPFRQCQAAVTDLKKGKRPVLCSADTQDEPYVCCPPVAPASNLRPSVRKCKEYAESFIRTVSVSSLLFGVTDVTKVSLKACEKRAAQFIVGGSKADPMEFPHMVAIGMVIDNELRWVCGGTIISERFVVTAAHCREYNRVKPTVIRTGTLTLNSPDASFVDYNIDSIFTPPTYSSKYKYDDITLLRVVTTIQFTKFIRPACLWQDSKVNVSAAVASGWGLTLDHGDPSNNLLKVGLKVYDNSVCATAYGNSTAIRSLNRGIIDSQLCAGDLAGIKDTCQGDSGGPLQIVLPGNKCVYYLVGITSFGRGCATKDSPGVYTRVSSYIDWIEKTVWG